MRYDRLVETVNQIQNIDLTIKRPKTMINMLKNTVEQANNQRIEAALVEGEFRQGLNDPSRTAAQWERNKGTRKNIGKMSVVDEYVKRVKAMRDNHLQLNIHEDWLRAKFNLVVFSIPHVP